MNHIENLKWYIKNDDIYNRFKEDRDICMSDFDRFCVGHCEDIEYVLNIIDKIKKTLVENCYAYGVTEDGEFYSLMPNFNVLELFKILEGYSGN